MQGDLVKAKSFVADEAAKICCTSLRGGAKLGDHELQLVIRFVLMLDGDKWAKVDDRGDFPEIYYDLVECLHCIHNRYSPPSPGHSESHHPYSRFLFVALRSAGTTPTKSGDTWHAPLITHTFKNIAPDKAFFL